MTFGGKFFFVQFAFVSLQKTYEDCSEFYGDSAKTMTPNVFFGRIAQFVAAFQRAREENKQREVREERSERDQRETERESKCIELWLWL